MTAFNMSFRVVQSFYMMEKYSSRVIGVLISSTQQKQISVALVPGIMK
jgi:hypothetical protein